MKFLQVHTFYEQYLHEFYKGRPHLLNAPFDEHIQGLIEDGFGAVHMLTPTLNKLGYEARLVIANDLFAQYQWAREHRVTIANHQTWIFEILLRQIESFQPDVLYLGDSILFDSRFIRTLSRKPSLVVGWRGAMIPPETDWKEYDLILSHLTVCRDEALRRGATAAEFHFPGFPKFLADAVRDVPKQYDVVFTGQWTPHHKQRNAMINHVVGRADERGYSVGLFLMCPSDERLPDPLACRNQGARYGVEMHRALKAGHVVLNAEIDLAKGEAGNMRLFETTGTGSFLLTEDQPNLRRFFEPGVEIETFAGESELIEKIVHYLGRAADREAIARRGQERCLREYSMEKRVTEFSEIIKKYCRRKSGASIPVGSAPEAKRSVAQQLAEEINLGNYAHVLNLIDQTVHNKIELPRIRFAQAIALGRLGRTDEAIDQLQALLQTYPRDAKVKLLLEQLSASKSANSGYPSASADIMGTPKAENGANGEDRGVVSPLTGSTNVVLEKEIDCRRLIENYRSLNVDVRKYFLGLDRIGVYRCLDTDYSFYYPFNISGDGEFYEALERIPWYYMDWKWEHEITKSLIKPTDQVLEIGCARGGFIERIAAQTVSCTGLELNESAVRVARGKGLNILRQSVQDHVRERREFYDVVCSFQVVEHIAQIREFVQASLDALKTGGKLVVSVPNNDSFVFRCDDVQILNRPPHHMGLWNARSLINLAKIFPLRLDGIELEPFQPYHLEWGLSLVKTMLIKRLAQIGQTIIKNHEPIISIVGEVILKEIPGHTILAHYTKL